MSVGLAMHSLLLDLVVTVLTVSQRWPHTTPETATLHAIASVHIANTVRPSLWSHTQHRSARAARVPGMRRCINQSSCTSDGSHEESEPWAHIQSGLAAAIGVMLGHAGKPRSVASKTKLRKLKLGQDEAVADGQAENLKNLHVQTGGSDNRDSLLPSGRRDDCAKELHLPSKGSAESAERRGKHSVRVAEMKEKMYSARSEDITLAATDDHKSPVVSASYRQTMDLGRDHYEAPKAIPPLRDVDDGTILEPIRIIDIEDQKAQKQRERLKERRMRLAKYLQEEFVVIGENLGSFLSK